MKKEIDVTPAKIEANRLNAQKSTGPRTRKGKAICKMNALKHGILASTAIIHAYEFNESASDFQALCQEFYQSLAPVGPMEEALVDRIIMVLWRQRRLHTAESGEIAKTINEALSPEGPDHTDMLFLMSQNDPAIPPLSDTVLSCKKVCEALKVVWDSIERAGLLEADEVKKYYQAVGRTYAHFIEEVMATQTKFAEDPQKARMGCAEPLQVRLKRELLAVLQGKLREAESRLNDQLARQSAGQQADKSAAMLPSPEALDKILRYETSLERQLYRALNQLERLQRARQGEIIPPPISIIT
ncbi:MAG TPA: hypothetical protein VGI03_13130 [Verrucomicrobiae bacterium]|jgi:hypothetical protein